MFFEACSPSEKIKMSASTFSEHRVHVPCAKHTSLHFSYLNKTQLGSRGSTEEEKHLLGL